MRHVRLAPAPVVIALAFTLLLSGTGALAPPARANPSIGFVETFPGTSALHWSSQDVVTNPGTGGVDGAGDGFLHLAIFALPFHLGAFSDSAAYTGDWIAGNVNRLKFWLNDTDAHQNIEMHVCIGNGLDLWESKQGFAPPDNAWGQFSLDVTDSTQFAHIVNFGGGFTDALHSVDRLLFRHDRAPFAQTPDTITGDVGIDNVETSNTLVDVAGLPPGTGAGRAVVLAAPYPNPSRGSVACAFDVSDAGPVFARVVDARGRIVRAEALAGAPPGRRVWVWDGRDQRGALAPAGAYRVRVTGAFGGTSRPIVLLR